MRLGHAQQRAHELGARRGLAGVAVVEEHECLLRLLVQLADLVGPLLELGLGVEVVVAEELAVTLARHGLARCRSSVAGPFLRSPRAVSPEPPRAPPSSPPPLLPRPTFCIPPAKPP